MGYGRIYRQGALILGSSLLILSFQNCAKAPAGVDGGSTSTGVVVTGSTAQFTKVTFDPNLEGRTGASGQRLDIDLTAGTVSSGGKICQLDVVREQKLKSILSVGRICSPDVLPAGMVSCMAVGLADIQLADPSGQSAVFLRKVVCNSGAFLCDGDDAALRSVIQDLITNPVAGCL